MIAKSFPQYGEASDERSILPRIEHAWQSLQLKANEPSVDMRSQ